MEIADIAKFLGRTPPFDTLQNSECGAVASSVTVRYARRGSAILRAGEPNEHLYIVRSGAVELMELGQKLTARLGEGSCFAYPSLLRGDEIRNAVTAIEDTLLYLIPAAVFHDLRHGHQAIRRFFIGAEADRLRAALADGEFPLDPGNNQPVRSLIRRTPVTCSAETTICEAAALMCRENISTVLITDGDVVRGIVTDRDMRARAIAENRPGTTSVQEIMTPDPTTVSETTLVLDALLLMLEKHFHHVPVMDKNSRLAGLVSATDILAVQSSSMVQIAKNIHRSSDVDSIVAALAPLGKAVSRLVKDGMGGTQVAASVSSIGLTAHRRIVELAEAALGSPPIPYSFLIFGSLARRDQTVSTDQDNGLLLHNDFDPALHGAYFEALAQQISDGLAACGYAYCGGGIMATTPDWRQTLSGWEKHFEGWINQPEPKALMHATIFFDMAHVYGDKALFSALQGSVLPMAAANKLFLAHMVENAMASKVPIGFFRRFVLTHDQEHRERLDIKKNGIAPLADIVRTYALAAGIQAVGIEERLEALEVKGRRAASDVAEMRDAWRFLMDVRIAHQARQVDQGEPPDNLIAPDALSPFEREHLRDAFSLIKTHQDGLSRAFAGGFY